MAKSDEMEEKGIHFGKTRGLYRNFKVVNIKSNTFAIG